MLASRMTAIHFAERLLLIKHQFARPEYGTGRYIRTITATATGRREGERVRDRVTGPTDGRDTSSNGGRAAGSGTRAPWTSTDNGSCGRGGGTRARPRWMRPSRDRCAQEGAWQSAYGALFSFQACRRDFRELVIRGASFHEGVESNRWAVDLAETWHRPGRDRRVQILTDRAALDRRAAAESPQLGRRACVSVVRPIEFRSGRHRDVLERRRRGPGSGAAGQEGRDDAPGRSANARNQPGPEGAIHR